MPIAQSATTSRQSFPAGKTPFGPKGSCRQCRCFTTPTRAPVKSVEMGPTEGGGDTCGTGWSERAADNRGVTVLDQGSRLRSEPPIDFEDDTWAFPPFLHEP